ncbi:MAG: dienelactone hydrolase family protein [bacterium]|nr:dienelactone hydrolase family protein [bacterium]
MKKILIAAVAGAALLTVLVLLPKNQPSPAPQARGNENTNVAALPSPAETDVTAVGVTYGDGYLGYLVRPKAEGAYPGVVMVHEWWGLNDNIKQMARVLANEGYTVLAVDLYNGEVAQTPERARELTSGLDQAKALEQLKAAVVRLKSEGVIKVGSLGWCFGGGQSLQLSLNSPLDATVIYYGTLVTDEAKLSAIRWPVLGVFGDQDKSITVESVRAFDAALDKLGVENEIHLYPGVGHAFANPSGANYAPQETKDAWEKTLAFLKKNLQTP